jgi:hypothetical protein
VTVLSFVLFVNFIGPFFANTFDWHGDDPTALLGPEWIWNYAFLWSIICFFVSAIYFDEEPIMSKDDLSEFDDDTLKKELEKRKKKKEKEIIPKVLDNIDWSTVLRLAENVKRQMVEQGMYDEDYSNYIFEEVMKSVFGRKYFDWHNKFIR